MGWQHHHELLAQQLDAFESRGLERPAHERHVERAGLQTRERIDGVLAVQDQAQVGQVLGEQRPQRRQYPGVRRWEGAYREIAGAPVLGLFRDAPRMFEAAENVVRVAKKYASRIGQRDVMAAAVEQLHADGALEPPNLLAQRRLRGSEPRRRAREAQLFGNGHEIAQMPELDAAAELRFAVLHLQPPASSTATSGPTTAGRSATIAGMRTAALVALIWASSASAQPPLPQDIDPQSYSRLPLILKDSLDAEGKRIFEAVNGKDANVPRLGPPASSLYSLRGSEPYDELNVLLRKASVGPRLFELSTLVPAREFNQQYEWSAHEIGARRAGVSQDAIDAIKYDRPVDGLPEKDAAVIEFGRALLRAERQVPSDLFAKMVRLFGREGTVEITMIMGDYAMTAMLLNAVDQHLPPGREPLLPPP